MKFCSKSLTGLLVVGVVLAGGCTGEDNPPAMVSEQVSTPTPGRVSTSVPTPGLTPTPTMQKPRGKVELTPVVTELVVGVGTPTRVGVPTPTVPPAIPTPTPTNVPNPVSRGWETRAPLLEANSETAVVESGGKVYVIGGYPSSRTSVATVQIYDIATDTWKIGPPLRIAVNHAMAAAVGGKIYLIGGQGSAGGRGPFLNTVFELDPAVGVWKERSAMPTARSGGVAVTIGETIYVAGGRPPHGHDFAAYTPAQDSWVVLPELLTQRNHLAGAGIDGRIYIVGGRYGAGFRSEVTDALEVFDPEKNSWASLTSMPTPRGGVNGIGAKGCLHVFGGEGSQSHSNGVFPNHEFYNPKTNSWIMLDPLPTPVHGVTGSAFVDPWIYLPGGGTRQGGSSGSTIHQVFRPDKACE